MPPKVLYMVTVRWPEVNGVVQWNNNAFEKRLNTIGASDWLRFNGYTWLFWSDKTAYELQQALNDRSLTRDFVLFQVIQPTRAGWADQWVWDWINRPHF